MSVLNLGTLESRFADIIWANEPISSGELCKISESELNWKKSTTFTVLKRLCEKGIFKNEKGTVSSVIKRDEFYSAQSKKFVEEAFSGSLPAFLASFASGKKITPDDAEKLRRLIDEYEEK